MKKTKNIFILIERTIFPYDILFSVGATDKEIFEYIEKNKKYKLSDKEKECLELGGCGKTTQLQTGHIVIRVRKEKTEIGFDLSVLVHEISHAVFLVMDRLGVTHTDSSDEVYAYYQAFIHGEIMKIVQKKK